VSNGSAAVRLALLRFFPSTGLDAADAAKVQSSIKTARTTTCASEACRCLVGVISGNAQKVQMMSGLPRQADMIVQDWQVRCRCADSQKYHLEFDSDLKLIAKRLVR
jgi:hypothetical protein